VKTVFRAAAALVLALGALLGAASSASADPTPTPTPTAGVNYIDYDGFGHTVLPSGQSLPTSFPTHVRITCTDGVCVIGGFSLVGTDGAFDVTQGLRLVVVDGKGTYAMPENTTNKCADNWIGPGTMTINATKAGYTASRTSADGGGDIDCGGGKSVYQGAFTVEVTGTFSGGNGCVLDSSCPTPTPSPTAIPAAAAGVPPTKATHFASPSTLSALPTAAKALTVHNALWAAAITVVLVLLVAFPTHLFNTATEHGAERAKQWWSKRRPRLTARITGSRAVEYRGWPLAAGGVLLASLISSFVDPTFGFNASSVRVYLSILTSFLLDAVAGWFLLIYFVRRANPKATAAFRFAPASLLVVAAAVVFTRVTGFAPGIIFGLVAGVAFGAVLATAEKAKVALIGIGYSFVIAVIGWVGYSILNATVGAHPAAGFVFLQETLSSMAIGGIAALPIALVPLRGLSGYDIFSWNRWVWGGAYAIGLLGFFIVLMPLPFSWTGVHINLIVWVAVYLAYGLAAVVAWLVLAQPWKRNDEVAKTGSPESA
jgi:hypothetical protein